MRGRQEAEPLKKYSIRLFVSDYEVLQSAYPNVGPTEIIRRLVRQHVRRIEDSLETQTSLPSLEAQQ